MALSKNLENPLMIPQRWYVFTAVCWVQKTTWNVWNEFFAPGQFWHFLGEFMNVSEGELSFQNVNSFKENNDSRVRIKGELIH